MGKEGKLLRTFIINGIIVTPEQIMTGYTLCIEDERITHILTGDQEYAPQDIVIDAMGDWVAPGLIDIHVHGALGIDTMQASHEDIHTIARYFASHGVTSYLPTTWSADEEQILAVLKTVETCPQPVDGAQHLGVHVEGPYLNPDYRGAQRIEMIRKPDPKEYRKWFAEDIVRLATIAPEMEGSKEFIKEAINNQVEIAIGHSGASYEKVIEAADQGVRQITHMFNGMPGLHHRSPGTLGGCLAEDRLFAQIICDGIHIHPQMVKMAVRAKTPIRTILITDAICGSGLPDGEYQINGQEMRVVDGVSRTLDGGLSGSTLTLDRAVKNTLDFTGLSLNEVLPMATSVPAKAMGWAKQKGIISPGADADIIILERNLQVRLTMVGGRVIYRKKKTQK